MNIKNFCEKYLKNYKINNDDTIDVNGHVHLDNRLGDIEKLPVKFGKLSGNFNCNFNELTTLEGCPNYVGGDFYCGWNKLTSLEYSPKYIGRDFGGDNLTHHVLGNVQGKIYSYNKQRTVI